MPILRRAWPAQPPTPDYIVGDEVSWLSVGDIHTGEIEAVAGRTAKVFDHAFRDMPTLLAAHVTLPFERLTLSRRAREDDKTTALVDVYRALRELADHGDLSMWTFLENEWPKVVPADLRALLNLGPDKADETEGDER